MPWVQIFGHEADVEINFERMFEFTNIRNVQPLKDVVYCDDGQAMQSSMPFHVLGSVGKPTRRYYSIMDFSISKERTSRASKINSIGIYIGIIQ